MKNSNSCGVALIAAMAAALATMAHHPTGVDPHASAQALAREMNILVGVHALGLLSVPLFGFGFAGLTRCLGWDRPAAQLALIVYAFSLVAIMFAAIADGPVNAALIPRALGRDGPAQQAARAALAYNVEFNQACAKVFVAGSSLAIMLWSVALASRSGSSRRLGVFGGVVGAAALAGLLSGHVRMSAHGFAFILLLQATWVVSVGVWMLRAGFDQSTTNSPTKT
jgi:hypothetical protein